MPVAPAKAGKLAHFRAALNVCAAVHVDDAQARWGNMAPGRFTFPRSRRSGSDLFRPSLILDLQVVARKIDHLTAPRHWLTHDGSARFLRMGPIWPGEARDSETLERFGDESAQIERTRVKGICIVHTSLDGREVVRRCRELFQKEFAFEYAIKWVPVDYWCDTDLDTIRALLAEKVRDRIAPDETWGMKVEKRRWQQYHTRDIVLYLAQAIDRRVNLDHPDKLVRVDMVGEQTAVSVLRPGEIFSITAPEELGTPPSPPAPTGHVLGSERTTAGGERH